MRMPFRQTLQIINPLPSFPEIIPELFLVISNEYDSNGRY